MRTQPRLLDPGPSDHLLARLFGCPLCCTPSWWERQRLLRAPGPLRWLNTKALGRASAVICITKQVESTAKGIFGAGIVSYIPNMLPHGYLSRAVVSDRPRGERPTALHVAWQAPKKGTLEVLRVAAQIPEADFVLVGGVPPDAQPEIDRTMAEVGQPENVTFTGPLFDPELSGLYARANVFLLPSHGEGFPMVILEALSHSLPVVATDVGEIAVMLGVGSPAPAGRVVTRASGGHGEKIHAAGEGRGHPHSGRAGLYRCGSTACWVSSRVVKANRGHRFSPPSSQRCSHMCLYIQHPGRAKTVARQQTRLTGPPPMSGVLGHRRTLWMSSCS